jgi:uncharacterized protein
VTLLPFFLLLVAVLGLWVHRNFSLAALTLAVIAGYFTGALADTAALWIGVAGAMAWLHTTRRGLQRVATGLAFFLFAVALGLLLLPGFPRTVVFEGVVLSPGAMPYTLGLGFAKVVTGIFILAFMHPGRVRSWGELGQVLARVAPVFIATAALVMVLTLALGYVRWDAKWTPLFFAWALANLFLTCLAEEAFFRGFVQRELTQLGRNRGFPPRWRSPSRPCSSASCTWAAAGNTRWPRPWRASVMASPTTARNASKDRWPCISA